MSLTSAIQAAVSGLGVSARRAEIVASNVANATTEGYAKRSLTVATAAQSPGVRAVGIERRIDAALIAESRLAKAEFARTDLLSRQFLRLESAFGSPGSSDGVTAAIDRLDAALIAAAGSPHVESRLAEVADATSALALRFKRASEAIQAVRSDGDRAIAADVATLNTQLSRVADLDRRIVVMEALGRDTSPYRDQRQQSIDAISRIVPIREVALPDGRTRLVSPAGGVLLDGRAAEFGFTPTGLITVAGPAPSTITLNGRPVPMLDGGPLGGGSLAAAFLLRDEVAPALQADLDALAADIAGRLAAADPTIGPGAPGVLTDHGSSVDPSRILGLSSRLELNASIDFDEGGDLWRIRSGLAAAHPSPSGEARLLIALQSALARVPDAPSARAAALADGVSHKRVTAEGDSVAARSRADAIESQVASGSVNTDAEMQDLLQLERSYAANARVLQTVDEMLTYLLAR